MLKLIPVLGNSQCLDGGAMFGNAPKKMWEKWCEVDADNRIQLACRALLVQEPHRNILLEAGVGNFFEPILRARYGIVESEAVLLNSLQELGLSDQDIDIVILSHLHFDHAGGILSAWQAGQALQLLFPRATFMVSEAAWQRANAPHPRDRASFIPDLNQLLEQSGRLHLVRDEYDDLLGKNYRFHFSNGHTPGMLLTEICLDDGPVVFAADLIPGAAWVHAPITMGYDRFPEQVIDEKITLLNYLAKQNGKLFFTHDKNIAMATVVKELSGKFSVIS